jgi:hypothetical protein
MYAILNFLEKWQLQYQNWQFLQLWKLFLPNPLQEVLTTFKIMIPIYLNFFIYFW